MIIPSIGNTPLVLLNNITNNPNIKIYAKLENQNPSGSIKDRFIDYIIKNGFATEIIDRDTILVEASSGNTATSVAMFASFYDMKSILYTDTKCSVEKINTIRTFGASINIVPVTDSSSPHYYQNIAKKTAQSNPNYYYINQYDNPSNPSSYHEMAKEIYEQLNGNVDYFVCGAGTGGTISGVSEFFKSKNKNIKTVLVDPIGSVLYDAFKGNQTVSKPWLIEGVGKTGAIPKALRFDVIDDAIQVSDKDSIKTCYDLIKKERIFGGGSSGLNVCGALQFAESLTLNAPINIVTIIPDTGFKYLSKIYDATWLKDYDITH